jgi:hypothetical protein
MARPPQAWIAAVLVVLGAHSVAAQSTRTPRAGRLGNINVLLVGAGYPSFDHPTFDDDVFPNLSIQRRIWRREMRRVPIWVRGAISFMADDDKFVGYTVWGENEIPPPGVLETVTERTSDVIFRGEALADLLHGSWYGVYAGGGFALHYVTFSSNGSISQIETFEANESRLAPSAAVGLRLFAPQQPITGYVECRLIQAYGKTDAVKSPSEPWLTDQLFEFTRADGWSIEAGLGLHW